VIVGTRIEARSASITYMIRHYAGRRRSDLVLITRIMPPSERTRHGSGRVYGIVRA
jgi:hypothetical protein